MGIDKILFHKEFHGLLVAMHSFLFPFPLGSCFQTLCFEVHSLFWMSWTSGCDLSNYISLGKRKFPFHSMLFVLGSAITEDHFYDEMLLPWFQVASQSVRSGKNYLFFSILNSHWQLKARNLGPSIPYWSSPTISFEQARPTWNDHVWLTIKTVGKIYWTLSMF